MIQNQTGTDGNAVHHQRRHKDRVNSRTGDAQTNKRDQPAAGSGGVARFGGDDAVRFTSAEFLAVLRSAFGLVIGDEVGDGPPRAGQGTDQHPND